MFTRNQEQPDAGMQPAGPEGTPFPPLPETLREDLTAYLEAHYQPEPRTIFMEDTLCESSTFTGPEPPCLAEEHFSYGSAEPCCKSAPNAAQSKGRRVRRSLEDILSRKEETFQQQLFRLIREKGMKNAEVYKRANLQKQLFSKIKADADYAPKKSTVLALCLSLQLSLDETLDLLGRAGYTLSRSNVSDLIVQYFIENEVFDVLTVDTALYEHDLPTLSNY